MNILGISLALIVILIYAVMATLKFIDGPMSPMAGGPLKRGTLISSHDIDWSMIVDAEATTVVEFQLVNTGTSRLVGVFLHQGELYAACDLGFIGRRAPGVLISLIQTAVLSLKNWHQQAVIDGRVVLRIQGNRFERHARKVDDQSLITTFKERAIKGGIKFFGFLEPPKEPPGEIWFFRLDSRQTKGASEPAQ